MSEKDRANLLAMLDAVAQIQTYSASVSDADEFHRNRLVFDGTLMNFVVLGEMATRVSEDLRRSRPYVNWADIRAFRNLVAHEYLGIDAEEVWQIIHDDIPSLKQHLEDMISDDQARS